MSCTSPFTVAMTRRPFGRGPADAFHVRLEVGDGGLHRLGRLQHERQLHLPGAEQLADHLHPLEQHVVDDRQRGDATGHRLVEIGGEAVAVAVDDAQAQALLHRQPAAVGLLGGERLDVGEHLEQALQRVVGSRSVRRRCGPATVVDQVEADLALLVGDAVQRHDLAGVDDRRVEPGLGALVEEHAVQHVARRRRQAEADVAQPEHGERAGDLGLDPPDRLHRLHGVAPQVVVAGGQGEREGVEDQVAVRQPVALGGDLGDAVGDLHLPLDVACLTALVDQQADHRRAVVAGEGEHPVHAAAGQLAVLEVGRVEDRPPADVLQRGLEHRRLGGVEHERHARLRGEAPGHLVHVVGAVAADVVDAHVEDVGALLDLLVGHLHAAVPVAGEHRVAERLRAVGVGALADEQHAQVLGERDRAVDRRHARLPAPGCVVPARRRGPPRPPGGGARASCRSSRRRRGRRARRRGVGGTRRAARASGRSGCGRRRRSAGRRWGAREIGHRRVLRQVAQVLLHLGRAGGAVDRR